MALIIKIWDDSRPRKDVPVEIIQPGQFQTWTAGNGVGLDFVEVCRRVVRWAELGMCVDVDDA